MEIKKILKNIGKGVAGLGLVGLAAYAYFKDPEKYSRDWINNLSSDEWETEREKVRQEYITSGTDTQKADYLQRIMRRFDSVKRDQEDDGSEYVYPHYSEHGGNLYKED